MFAKASEAKGFMALNLDQIRALAARVAASHGLEIVDIEYQGGGGKHRTLRVFIEKNAAGRAQLAARAAGGDEEMALPSGVDVDHLAGITHEDCQVFSSDFGTVLDVEELVPGMEYLLEVSSPGLDRKLVGEADFRRFAGSKVKLRTFEPVAGNRHWQGRLTEVKDGGKTLILDVSGTRPKSKTASTQMVEIALTNIEKANLEPEF